MNKDAETRMHLEAALARLTRAQLFDLMAMALSARALTQQPTTERQAEAASSHLAEVHRQRS